MHAHSALTVAALLALAGAPARSQLASAAMPADSVPLPEHPRPDFERADWRNLNGRWRFRFDAGDEGERGRWYAAPLERPLPQPVAERLVELVRGRPPDIAATRALAAVERVVRGRVQHTNVAAAKALYL